MDLSGTEEVGVVLERIRKNTTGMWSLKYVVGVKYC
jgi:hypothetical protein